MARWIEPTPEQTEAWAEWVAERPECVRNIAEKLPPWELFRLKTTGQRVTVASFFENGTVSVEVRGEFNFHLFDANVFGIDPADLEPCDLPAPDELTGTMMSPEQVDDNVDALRVMIRPDLFTMSSDGKAVRKN
jgi:hypothetical protein